MSRMRPTRASVWNPSAPRPVAMKILPVPGRWFLRGTRRTTTPRFLAGSPASPRAPTPRAPDLNGDVHRGAVADVRERDDGDLAARLVAHVGDHRFHAAHGGGVEDAREIVDVARGGGDRDLREDEGEQHAGRKVHAPRPDAQAA